MLIYSFQEIALMLIAAIMLDWLIGDPQWPTHPVIYIGRLIRWLEKRLSLAKPSLEGSKAKNGRLEKLNGIILCLITVSLSYSLIWALLWICNYIHPWLGYAVNVWFISTTIAIKGLKDAGMAVYQHLYAGNLVEARTYAGYIVGRDTSELSQTDVVRATVETVAENIVDAVVSPLFYALLGGAPLAMLYRAANTLDSMVGYKNETYLNLGWASARWDDHLNWLPARLTGMLLVISTVPDSKLFTAQSWKAIRVFAHLHPSPNSGIPESAVAGALGVELGGRNYYAGVPSDRARMGWHVRDLSANDILSTIQVLFRVSYLWVGGLLCALFVFWF
jgi:adenosylcobinamide-phosphate synthase